MQRGSGSGAQHGDENDGSNPGKNAHGQRQSLTMDVREHGGNEVKRCKRNRQTPRGLLLRS